MNNKLYPTHYFFKILLLSFACLFVSVLIGQITDGLLFPFLSFIIFYNTYSDDKNVFLLSIPGLIYDMCFLHNLPFFVLCLFLAHKINTYLLRFNIGVHTHKSWVDYARSVIIFYFTLFLFYIIFDVPFVFRSEALNALILIISYPITRIILSP